MALQKLNDVPNICYQNMMEYYTFTTDIIILSKENSFLNNLQVVIACKCVPLNYSYLLSQTQ